MLKIGKIAARSFYFSNKIYLPAYFFSQSQLNLSEYAQRAVWSSAILSLILTNDPPNNVYGESLRESIINIKLPESTKRYNF